MTFQVDYMTSTTHDILSRLVPYYEQIREQMDMEGLLCEEAGQRIVFIFGFKGDFKSVRNQFTQIISVMKAKLELGRELEEKDRLFLLNCAERDGAFIVDDPHRLATETNAREELDGMTSLSDMSLIIHNMVAGLEKSRIYRKQLHDRKQCLCYCNY